MVNGERCTVNKERRLHAEPPPVIGSFSGGLSAGNSNRVVPLLRDSHKGVM